MTSTGRVSLVTLGCARNEVDSEELAGRLDAAGWDLVDEAPDVVVVNGKAVGVPGRLGTVARVEFGPGDPAAG